MAKQWLIRAGKNGELVEDWLHRNRKITTVGWDVGDLSKDDPGWRETKKRIVDEYNPDDPGRVTGRVRGFVGVRDDESRNLESGDKIVALGDASVVFVATVGEYRYEENGLQKAPSHTYWREVKEIQSGHVKLRDLPERFRQGGKNSLQLGSTLQKYRSGSEKAVNELASILEEREQAETVAGSR